MNLSGAIDSLIGAVAPGWALRRAQSRVGLQLATYRAAEINRLTRDWNARNRSADAAIISDRKTLDARSRQLVRDDPNANSVRRAYVRNVVARGISCRAAARDAAGKPMDAFNKAFNDQFYDWARNPKLVDRERRRNLFGIQRWALGEMIEVGEALMVESYESRPHHCGLVLQPVEADQLDTIRLEYQGREVRGGVEVDAYGAAVAYWIYPRHPNDYLGLRYSGSSFSLESIRVPAERMLHLFDPERVRQTRGVSRMAPVMRKMRDLDDYDFAQLLAAKAEACIGLIITQAAGSQRIGLAEDGAQPATDADGNDPLSMQPMMVARLGENEAVTGFTPTRPGNLYEPYVTEQKRTIAAGSGLSYEQISRDFSKGTYSSQRQTSNEDRREFEPLQDLLIVHLCQPIAEAFIQLSVIEGRIKAPGYSRNPDLYHYINWQPQAWEWVDKKNEADAEAIAVEKGITSTIDVADSHGDDAFEIADKQAEIDAYREAARVKARAKHGLAPAAVVADAVTFGITDEAPAAIDAGAAEPQSQQRRELAGVPA